MTLWVGDKIWSTCTIFVPECLLPQVSCALDLDGKPGNLSDRDVKSAVEGPAKVINPGMDSPARIAGINTW